MGNRNIYDTPEMRELNSTLIRLRKTSASFRRSSIFHCYCIKLSSAKQIPNMLRIFGLYFLSILGNICNLRMEKYTRLSKNTTEKITKKIDTSILAIAQLQSCYIDKVVSLQSCVDDISNSARSVVSGVRKW